jgi:hypothetical protein
MMLVLHHNHKHYRSNQVTKRLVSVDSVCGIPIDDRKQPYKSDFWARICFWAESNGYFVFDCYETCPDMGDGTYGQCKTYYFQFRKSDESSSTIDMMTIEYQMMTEF